MKTARMDYDVVENTCKALHSLSGFFWLLLGVECKREEIIEELLNLNQVLLQGGWLCCMLLESLLFWLWNGRCSRFCCLLFFGGVCSYSASFGWGFLLVKDFCFQYPLLCVPY